MKLFCAWIDAAAQTAAITVSVATRTSGHRQRRAIDVSERADHELMREVLLLADVLEQLRVGLEAKVHRAAPGLGVGARIINGHVAANLREIGTRELLDGVELIGVRRSTAINPEALVVANRIDDERVAFPPADRVAVVGGLQVLRVAAAVRVDRAERVRAAD